MSARLLPALVLLAAGCGAPAPTPDGDAAAEPPGTLEAVAYACPPGADLTVGTQCVGRLASLKESHQEPYIAIHPTDPKVMAIGVNTGHSVNGADADTSPGFDLVSLGLFVTTDAGRTWTPREVPAFATPGVSVLPVEARVYGDPALVFDRDGRLHLSVLASTDGVAGGFAIAYIATPDLGSTWTEAIVLSTDGDNDRNWIGLGPDGTLLVPWQSGEVSSDVAWSVDGGATWRTQRPEQRTRDCSMVSRPVFLDAPIVACAGFGPVDPKGIEIHTLDTTSGDLPLRAQLPGLPCRWPQLVLAGDVLVLLAELCTGRDGVVLVRSHDGGRTWTEPMSPVGPRGMRPWSAKWFTADPWGSVHIVGPVTEVLVPTDEPAIGHVALRGDLSPLHEAELRPAGRMEARRDSLPVAYGDHYHGLAFHDAGGFAVWTRQEGLDYTVVEVSLVGQPAPGS